MRKRRPATADGSGGARRVRSAIAWAGLLAVAVGAGCWDWRLGLAIAGLIAFWDASRVGRVDRD